jgi:ABC-2 type transport system ATP-binding protein/lipopolysaccharide transport system ATP-binding protein
MYEITLKKVRVEFPIYDRGGRSLRDMVLFNPVRRQIASTVRLVGGEIKVNRLGNTVVCALDDVDLSLVDGDRLGLIGHNGAGKTTILRAMAGIFEPVAGEIITRGEITSLFGITDGMDIDATGYETIRLRGLMLGRSPKEVKETAQEIADFTELGEYLSMPLRTYSSGMLVRLAFGIATSHQPEILLMDEIIGAGDAAFFNRAQLRLKSFIEATGIMVVATHNPEILRRWCNKAILMSNGHIVAQGSVEDVIAEQARLIQATAAS